MNKKMLYISYCFPPMSDAESFLQMRILPEIVKNNWDTEVITVDCDTTFAKQDINLLKPIPKSVTIHSIKSLERYNILFKTLRQYSYFLLSKLFYFEPAFFWIRNATKAGKKLIDKGNFTLLHSKANFHSSNLVGLALKKYSGLPWVAHFSDPWYDNPFIRTDLWNRKQILKCESDIIRNADAVVFTTQQTLDLVMAKYPAEWLSKAYVVPHCYVKSNIETATPLHDELNITYTGNFYGIRTPEPIIYAIERLKNKINLEGKLKVNFIGYVPPEYIAMINKAGLQKIIICHGSKSYDQASALARASDVLLIVDAPGAIGIFLPSKLVEYLDFRKPILGITPTVGASADLIRSLDCPVIDPLDIDGIALEIESMLTKWNNKELMLSPRFDAAADVYSSVTIGKHYCEVFDQLTINN